MLGVGVSVGVHHCSLQIIVYRTDFISPRKNIVFRPAG
jgi:hypothetical protein